MLSLTSRMRGRPRAHDSLIGVQRHLAASAGSRSLLDDGVTVENTGDADIVTGAEVFVDACRRLLAR